MRWSGLIKEVRIYHDLAQVPSMEGTGSTSWWQAPFPTAARKGRQQRAEQPDTLLQIDKVGF